MKILQAEFTKSSASINGCTNDGKPEFAFIGRSNVGKSSLINMLTAKTGLAKTSQTPGKTKLINHFLINSEWYIVDLPGYGYARISKDERAKIEKMNMDYLSKREVLYCIFLLIDSRLTPQASDLKMIDWFGKNEIPFALVFTKTDKLSINQVRSNSAALFRELRKTWAALPECFYTSSTNKLGREELLQYIHFVLHPEE